MKNVGEGDLRTSISAWCRCSAVVGREGDLLSHFPPNCYFQKQVFMLLLL